MTDDEPTLVVPDFDESTEVGQLAAWVEITTDIVEDITENATLKPEEGEYLETAAGDLDRALEKLRQREKAELFADADLNRVHELLHAIHDLAVDVGYEVDDDVSDTIDDLEVPHMNPAAAASDHKSLADQFADDVNDLMVDPEYLPDGGCEHPSSAVVLHHRDAHRHGGMQHIRIPAFCEECKTELVAQYELHDLLNAKRDD